MANKKKCLFQAHSPTINLKQLCWISPAFDSSMHVVFVLLLECSKCLSLSESLAVGPTLAKMRKVEAIQIHYRNFKVYDLQSRVFKTTVLQPLQELRTHPSPDL